MKTSSSQGSDPEPQTNLTDPAGARRRRRSPTPNPAAPYDRARDLPRLMPLWPEDVRDDTLAGRQALVLRLGAVLRRERQRGIAGAWGYDLARHRQLVIAYRAEHDAWQRLLRHAVAERQSAVQPRAISRGASPAPSSWPTSSALQRNSAPPSDSRAAAPISPDILTATDCSGSASAASGI
jgi:hypothetical protein